MCKGADLAGDALAELTAAAERLLSEGRDDVNSEQIRSDLVRLRHVCDLLELEFSAQAARFAEMDECELEGSLSATDWIRHNCGCRATRQQALSAWGSRRQPCRSVDATRRGQIGFGHLALLASTARAVTASSATQGFAEEPLLSKALEHSVSRFRHDCAHARHAADAQAFLAEHVDSVKARSLKLMPSTVTD